MAKPEFSSTVRVQYLPDRSNPPEGPFAFAYTVNIRNTGDKPLKLYTLYAPPQHEDGTVQRTKAAAGSPAASRTPRGRRSPARP